MAFQKKKIDNIHPQALQQIKDVVEGKTPAAAGFGGKTPDVSGFTKLALDQIKSVVGGGSGGGVGHAVWKGSLSTTPNWERVEPIFSGEGVSGYCVYTNSDSGYAVTYSEQMPPDDFLQVPDDVMLLLISPNVMMYMRSYDDGVHGTGLIAFVPQM